MFCRKCGYEIKDGAKFCVKCGNAVSSNQPDTAEMMTASAEENEEYGKEKPAAKDLSVSNDKKRKSILPLVVILFLLVCAVAGAGVYYVTQVRDDAGQEKRDDSRDDDDFDDDDENSLKSDSDQADTEEESSKPESEAGTESGLEAEATEKIAEAAQEHSYQIVVADVSWTEAYRAAKAVENGYLLNINSQEEWFAVLQLIQEQGLEKNIFWIGGIRRGDASEYYWVDVEGNSVGDALNNEVYWLPGEPTFYDSDNEMEERYIDMFYSSSLERWVWNDTVDDLLAILPYYSGKIAYIIEIENT